MPSSDAAGQAVKRPKLKTVREGIIPQFSVDGRALLKSGMAACAGLPLDCAPAANPHVGALAVA